VLLGHCIVLGPITWGCGCEKKTSCSSCEFEIKSMDEGCKTLGNLHLLMKELNLPDMTTHPNDQPWYNDKTKVLFLNGVRDVISRRSFEDISISGKLL
jgi:hypothetical protein